MRIGLSAVCLAMLTVPAIGGVSDDLVFCSRLSNGKERIACYDAAARIAANAPTGRLTRPSGQPILVTAPAADAPTVQYESRPIERLPFQGAYVAVGGGYGLGSPHNYGVGSTIGPGIFGVAHPSGGSAAGAVGYDLQFGHFVVGLELSGRYGREQFSDSRTDNATGDPLGFVNIGTSTKSYQFNVDSSVHLALRSGVAINDTLFFGKLGVGATHQRDSSIESVFGTRCDLSNFVNNTSVCVSRSPLIGSNFSHSNWTPSVLFGMGVEQNFGRFFGRIEGEAEAIRAALTPDQWFWTVRALGMIGVRF